MAMRLRQAPLERAKTYARSVGAKLGPDCEGVGRMIKAIGGA
jgi:hypothetical protein